MADNETTLTMENIREDNEDYLSTIWTIQAFISETTWDMTNGSMLHKSNACVGRKMSIPSISEDEKPQYVTPDIVIQRNDSLGYVVEVKKSLPQTQDYWKKTIAQLQKYNDDIIGWWTPDEMIDRSCVVLLLEASRVVEFVKYMTNYMENEEYSFQNKTSVIEFIRNKEVHEFIFLRKHWGEIEDDVISNKLTSGVKVPLEEVIASYGLQRFYDHEPHVEYTMIILWNDFFTNFRAQNNIPYDEVIKAYPIEINVGEITRQLQMSYGHCPNGRRREVSFPKTSWVVKALEAFVKINLAVKTEDPKVYIILFKNLRGDILQKFMSHRNNSKKATTTQPELFPKEQVEEIDD